MPMLRGTGRYKQLHVWYLDVCVHIHVCAQICTMYIHICTTYDSVRVCARVRVCVYVHVCARVYNYSTPCLRAW